MTVPQIAIVGRPNVGKSSLLNRLARQRVSIVAPAAGVTRDRVSALIELDGPLEGSKGTPSKFVELVDTGGYGVYTADGQRFDDVGADLTILSPQIEDQIRVAMDQAELVLLVVDAQSGITGLEHAMAAMLRQQGVAGKVLLVANKVDSDKWIAHGLEAAGLGFGQPMCVSARTGYGTRELLDALYERVSLDPKREPESPQEMKIAIVSKRNAGKSTLVNALAGEPRVIVSEIAGTTRDAIDVRFEIEGRTMLAIDTAGVRKRKSFADEIELYAYHRMLAAIRRADVVLFLIDAQRDVSQVDKRLSKELQDQFKPTVIVVNKWDLVDEGVSPKDYLKYLTQQLRGLDYAPIVFISAKEGQGVRDVVAMAFNLHRQASHFEPTSRLNEVISSILQRRGPSSKLGTQAKILYACQIGSSPPTIVLVVNQPKLFRGAYERYLINRLREALPYSEVPIRLLLRKRKRPSLAQLKNPNRMEAAQLDQR
ncbi:MAG: ribosome biogenesis GTPase Der [Planctomycetes bacterium]|nr:ribosome biogenesis GTPase Der [Planctomycetota bacterium]